MILRNVLRFFIRVDKCIEEESTFAGSFTEKSYFAERDKREHMEDGFQAARVSETGI